MRHAPKARGLGGRVGLPVCSANVLANVGGHLLIHRRLRLRELAVDPRHAVILAWLARCCFDRPSTAGGTPRRQPSARSRLVPGVLHGLSIEHKQGDGHQQEDRLIERSGERHQANGSRAAQRLRDTTITSEDRHALDQPA
jgi:hypothetical protein